MIICLMGPQACGKGTQGIMLGRTLNLPVISSGEMLRYVKPDDPNYELVQSQLNVGKLVDQNIVAELLKTRTSQSDCKNGYILDGWFRSPVDVTFFDPKPDKVIVINIPRDESVRRVTGRRICEADGKNFNIYTLPADQIKCKGKLVQREDDTPEAVEKRLEIYYTDTVRVIEELKKKGIVSEIDGMGTPVEVFERVKKAVV